MTRLTQIAYLPNLLELRHAGQITQASLHKKAAVPVFIIRFAEHGRAISPTYADKLSHALPGLVVVLVSRPPSRLEILRRQAAEAAVDTGEGASPPALPRRSSG